jgi:hypothetical protein
VKKRPFIEKEDKLGVLCIYFVLETKRNTNTKTKKEKLLMCEKYRNALGQCVSDKN